MDPPLLPAGAFGWSLAKNREKTKTFSARQSAHKNGLLYCLQQTVSASNHQGVKRLGNKWTGRYAIWFRRPLIWPSVLFGLPYIVVCVLRAGSANGLCSVSSSCFFTPRMYWFKIHSWNWGKTFAFEKNSKRFVRTGQVLVARPTVSTLRPITLKGNAASSL